jgi:uncharacterized protein (DUF302 family)
MTYGREVTTGLPVSAAVEHVKSLLKDEGFGVLCDIDVAATMREKLGEEFRQYRILGACNPALAHRALSVESQLGLLLPCNVVVQDRDGTTIVSAIDARTLLGVVGNPSLLTTADDVNAKLNAILEKIAASGKP